MTRKSWFVFVLFVLAFAMQATAKPIDREVSARVNQAVAATALGTVQVTINIVCPAVQTREHVVVPQDCMPANGVTRVEFKADNGGRPMPLAVDKQQKTKFFTLFNKTENTKKLKEDRFWFTFQDISVNKKGERKERTKDLMTPVLDDGENIYAYMILDIPTKSKTPVEIRRSKSQEVLFSHPKVAWKEFTTSLGKKRSWFVINKHN